MLQSSYETMRRYFSQSFFKDPLHIYRTRPIYRLFTSGKQKAFDCPVHLHRYNEATPAGTEIVSRVSRLKKSDSNRISVCASYSLFDLSDVSESFRILKQKDGYSDGFKYRTKHLSRKFL